MKFVTILNNDAFKIHKIENFWVPQISQITPKVSYFFKVQIEQPKKLHLIEGEASHLLLNQLGSECLKK